MNRPSRRLWLTSTSRGSTDETPCTVASSTGQIEPMAITTSTIVPVRPRNAITTGMKAETGTGRTISSIGATYSRAIRELPITAPSAMPANDARTQP